MGIHRDSIVELVLFKHDLWTEVTIEVVRFSTSSSCTVQDVTSQEPRVYTEDNPLALIKARIFERRIEYFDVMD